jgi:hypothetical protein
MTTIIGLFDSVSEAEKAARDLMSTGFSHEDIGLIASDATGEWSCYKVSTLEGAAPSPPRRGGTLVSYESRKIGRMRPRRSCSATRRWT